MLYDRRLLLAEPMRSQVLALDEVLQYGRDSYGDPDYVSLYGLAPKDWHSCGVRILGRTAVECTHDRLAGLIAHDVAEVARRAPTRKGMIVDLFAGSANTLFWLERELSGFRAMGFELDEDVFAATRGNLGALGLELDVRRAHYLAGLDELELSEEDLLVAFVAPPWGDALSDAGLDLSRTKPPVFCIVEDLDVRFPRHRLLIAVQVYERLEPSSVRDLQARLGWSELRTYVINAPGENHGVLLGTLGWRPGPASVGSTSAPPA